MCQKVVAYIDLLGFSNCVKNNSDEAIMMLSNFNTILGELNFERLMHPSAGYVLDLQKLARRTSNESFEHFIPFSDSVFITSTDCCNFVMQLGSFVRKSFLFNANVFESLDNPDDPMASHYISVDTSDPDNIRSVDIPCNERAVLFRGGIAFGEVIETTPIGLFNNQKAQYNNLMGEAVVRAVKMEGIVKGPRLVFDQSVYEQLNDEAKLYVRLLPEKNSEEYYEILWPAMGYILENKNTFKLEINHFYEIFNPDYNLWNFYKKSDVAEQYESFLKLIVVSTIQIYDYMGHTDFIRDKILEVLRGSFTDDERTHIFEGII